MYCNTIEEERDLLGKLWNVFDGWVVHKASDLAAGTYDVPGNIACPKCHIGMIKNLGTVDKSRSNLGIYSMKHQCQSCREVFDRIDIGEDIYRNAPHEMIDALETPLGTFRVLLNGKPILFCHSTYTSEIEGHELTEHLMDIDTSQMKKGDEVFTGFETLKLESIGSDEREIYIAAENDDYYMVFNGEEITVYEANLDDYTFESADWNEHGFEYVIHQDLDNLKNIKSRFCRVITQSIAWGLKSMCENYAEIIEQAAW